MTLWHILSLLAALLGAGLFWYTNHQDPPEPEPIAIEIAPEVQYDGPDPAIVAPVVEK